MPEDKKTETADKKEENKAELSENDLDQVSGGLNPQPLPPIEDSHR